MLILNRVYWLYDTGQPTDEYDSTPGYFDATQAEMQLPKGGDAQKLGEAFGAKNSLRRLKHIFQLAENANRSGDVDRSCLIGEDIHRELVRALAMPLFAVETGYYTIANGFLPGEFNKSDFRECGTSD